MNFDYDHVKELLDKFKESVGPRVNQLETFRRCYDCLQAFTIFMEDHLADLQDLEARIKQILNPPQGNKK